jgi:DNA-binding HxlR family transcriptional regulator
MIETLPLDQQFQAEPCEPSGLRNAAARVPAYLCAVEEAARIVGQKWTLQIVNVLIDFRQCRFCELQDALGGVNPSTLSARLKMLEEQGLVQREQVSSVPPHVVYRLTPMGEQLSGAIRELTDWGREWLCEQRPAFPLQALIDGQ